MGKYVIYIKLGKGKSKGVAISIQQHVWSNAVGGDDQGWVEYPNSNDVAQLILYIFIVVPSFQFDESSSIEANDDPCIQRRNCNAIYFSFYHMFSKPLCEVSFVLGFFLTFMKKSLKKNVTIWVESLSH